MYYTPASNQSITLVIGIHVSPILLPIATKGRSEPGAALTSRIVNVKFLVVRHTVASIFAVDCGRIIVLV